MNNATHENSIHSASVPQDNDQNIPGQLIPEGQLNPVEQKNISEILHQLDQLRYSPRSVTIRDIMKYAHKKNEFIH